MSIAAAQTALKQYFGYDEFRPMQEEIIETVLNEQDGVVLMPTGGGKSVCYQIPALVRSGLAVVVSPLIALMKDQVEGLIANGVPAAFLNSSQNDREQTRVLEAIRERETKLLYVSPEKLISGHFLDFLQQLEINLFAVDEAHCISSWGHDFRPEYTKLSTLKQRFPKVPVLALTATADKLTRNDIIRQLHLQDPKVFLASFDRPNLSLTVLPGRKRLESILKFLKGQPDTSGIIYCLSRNNTETLAQRLRDHGFKAAHYHAGMAPRERAEAQQAFIEDRVPIVCATIAFGMGIDKSNVRWVLHYNMPKNIEGYYQEIGRAGRDGLPSETVLFYSYADVVKLRSFAEESGQPGVQLAKLERMQQYAEAMICRRKVLLAYFGEALGEDCGNCDVCQDPPTYVDGTVLAQKALSAIYRMQESAPMGTLIDVLRGSARRDVIERGYDKIKTYGAGADIPYGDWQQYLVQMLNAGYLEIAYDQGNSLKLTSQSHDVLFRGKSVSLYRQLAAKSRTQRVEARSKPKSKRMQLIEDLFEQLRDLRKNLASNAGIAPYLVFSDATLKEMAAERPTTEKAFRDISGVGEAKFRQYGHVFIEEIMRFILEKRADGANIKGSTYLETFSLYRRGMSPEDMAQTRQLSAQTIFNHLGVLYEQGYAVQLERYINEQEREAVRKAMGLTGSDKVNDLFEYLEGLVPYDKIRLGVSYWRKKQQDQAPA